MNKHLLCFLVKSGKIETNYINIYIDGGIENLKGYTPLPLKCAQVWVPVCQFSLVPRSLLV